MRTAVSLFSGIGGLDEGIHQAGFNSLLCSELDPNASLTLNAYYKNKIISPLITGDINSISLNNILSMTGLQKGELDLLAGGPPCQSFSLIGSRKSLGDHRGMLLMKMIDFAETFYPKAILIEQVKGLLSASGFDNKRGSALMYLISELEQLGYTIRYKVLNAANYGVPQLRERVFIVGLLGEQEFIFPESTHEDLQANIGQKHLFGKQPFLTLRDAISDLPAPVPKGSEPLVPNHIDITPARDRERIRGVPEGACLARQLHLPADQRQRLNPEKDTTKFRRLSWSLPALTLRGGEAFYHPEEDRYLTPREYMRIHGFSDDHILIGPIRGRTGSVKTLDQHRLVANSVPPPLARAVAAAIAEQIPI